MSKKPGGVSRRRFLQRVGVGVVGAAAGSPIVLLSGSSEAEGASSADASPAGAGPAGDTRIPVALNINGKSYQLEVEARTTLADALRYHIGLTGTKVACDRGACGACTVIADGKTAYSCMMLAADARGKKIRTVESLAHNGRLAPLQQAFVDHDGMMCGFCTPGFVMSCTALLESNPRPNREQVQQAVRGNLCRCGTYPRIFEACLAAAGVHGEGEGNG